MKKVNRILTPVLAFLVFPVLWFMPMFNILVTSGILTNDDGSKANVLEKYLGLRQYMSFDFIARFMNDDKHSNLINAIADAIKNSDGSKKISEIITSINWLYAAGVFLCLVVLLTLAFIVFAAIGKKRGATIGIGIGAAVSTLMTNVCFNAFAKPFLNGHINISSIAKAFVTTDEAGSALSSFSSLSGLFNSIAKVNAMSLTSAYSFTLFILAVAVIFSIAAAVSKD